jgi:hypothetical protein
MMLALLRRKLTTAVNSPLSVGSPHTVLIRCQIPVIGAQASVKSSVARFPRIGFLGHHIS